MPAKLLTDDKEHIVIRPLAYCKEKEIEQYALFKQYPIISGSFCGVQPNLQRETMKQMLNEWDINFPGRLESMFTAMQNVVPSHLSDRSLFDFQAIARNDAHTAFDKEEIKQAAVTETSSINKHDAGQQKTLNIKELT